VAYALSDDPEGQYCNRNCIGCNLSFPLTAGLNTDKLEGNRKSAYLRQGRDWDTHNDGQNKQSHNLLQCSLSFTWRRQ